PCFQGDPCMPHLAAPWPVAVPMPTHGDETSTRFARGLSTSYGRRPRTWWGAARGRRRTRLLAPAAGLGLCLAVAVCSTTTAIRPERLGHGRPRAPATRPRQPAAGRPRAP